LRIVVLEISHEKRSWYFHTINSWRRVMGLNVEFYVLRPQNDNGNSLPLNVKRYIAENLK